MTDGKHQHPTQTFLDLYSIRETQGKIDDLKVAMVGDLKHGRTVHSLSIALSNYNNVELCFVAPDCLQMPDYIVKTMGEKEIRFRKVDSIESVLNEVDILYMTRIQKERFDDEKEYDRIKDVFRLSAAMLKDAKPNMKVLHPLPRYKYALEIAFDVDKTPHAYYFEQALNGLFVREALFALVTGRVGNTRANYQRQTMLGLAQAADLCPNEKCISRPEHCEGVEPKLTEKGKCYYCETRFDKKEGNHGKI